MIIYLNFEPYQLAIGENELLMRIISVDRRLTLMKTMKGHTLFKASDIAHETDRSTQNISRALHELEEKGLIECLTPDKSTWKTNIYCN